MNKSYAVLVVLAVLVLVGFSIYGSKSAGAKGKVVFAVTDATADIQNISSINITIDQISVHNEEEGWVVVSTDTKEFDLLELKSSGALELAAEANLPVGTYDHIRLSVAKVVVVTGGQSIEAKIPSNKLTFTGRLVVNEDTTSTITFDFLADKSLHRTGSGKFILAPVVRLETQSGATVSFEGKKVKIRGGKIEHQNTQGMDENGEIRVNGRLDEDELDEIDGVIKIRSRSESEAGITVTAAQAIDRSVDAGLSTVLSVRLTSEDGNRLWKVTGLDNLELETVYIDAMTGAVVSFRSDGDDRDDGGDDDDEDDEDEDDDGDRDEDEDEDDDKGLEGINIFR